MLVFSALTICKSLIGKFAASQLKFQKVDLTVYHRTSMAWLNCNKPIFYIPFSENMSKWFYSIGASQTEQKGWLWESNFAARYFFFCFFFFLQTDELEREKFEQTFSTIQLLENVA